MTMFIDFCCLCPLARPRYQAKFNIWKVAYCVSALDSGEKDLDSSDPGLYNFAEFLGNGKTSISSCARLYTRDA